MQENYSEDWRLVIERDLTRVLDTLYRDDGGTGVTYRLARLEGNMSDLIERDERRQKKQDRIEAGVWIGVVLMILTLIVQHIK